MCGKIDESLADLERVMEKVYFARILDDAHLDNPAGALVKYAEDHFKKPFENMIKFWQAKKLIYQ